VAASVAAQVAASSVAALVASSVAAGGQDSRGSSPRNIAIPRSMATAHATRNAANSSASETTCPNSSACWPGLSRIHHTPAAMLPAMAAVIGDFTNTPRVGGSKFAASYRPAMADRIAVWSAGAVDIAFAIHLSAHSPSRAWWSGWSLKSYSVIGVVSYPGKANGRKGVGLVGDNAELVGLLALPAQGVGPGSDAGVGVLGVGEVGDGSFGDGEGGESEVGGGCLP
jgi:hypothetical protein